MFSLTISGWELKYSGCGFWRQQFQRPGRTLQHCFLFSPFIPMNDGSLCSTQPYLQLLQLCCCWTGVWDNSLCASSKHKCGIPGGSLTHTPEAGTHPLATERLEIILFPFWEAVWVSLTLISISFIHLGSLNGFSNHNLVNNIMKMMAKVIFLFVCVRGSVISICNIFLFNEVECIIIIISLISLTNNHVCGLSETIDFVKPDMSWKHLIYK